MTTNLMMPPHRATVDATRKPSQSMEGSCLMKSAMSPPQHLVADSTVLIGVSGDDVGLVSAVAHLLGEDVGRSAQAEGFDANHGFLRKLLYG